MTKTTATRGEQPCVRHGEVDGLPVVYVPTSNGQEVVVPAARWDRHLWLGFPFRLSNDGNGHSRSYPRCMARDPSPHASRARALSLARALVAQRLVEDELATGKPAPAKGWVVRHADGDPLNCLDGNLVCRPAKGCRNSYRAVWTVRERWTLASMGLSPNAVFAQRRKAEHERRNLDARNIPADTVGGLDCLAEGGRPPSGPFLPSERASLTGGRAFDHRGAR